jgi:lactate dehydrogenase-like 2-hydroxyacid dehydrogenase
VPDSAARPIVLHVLSLPSVLRERLAGRYEVHGPLARSVPEAIPDAARGARALVTLGGFRTDAAMLDALPELGLVCCYGTGFEGVDRAAAAARGILVAHAGDSNATSVAEFAMGLVIAASRLMLPGDRLVREGGWTRVPTDRMPLVPGLAGRRLGIYGLGAIGERVARRAAGFEMEIGYHNRRRRDDVALRWLPSLLALAEWADVLLVTARAGDANRGAVDAAVLRALGPQGVLVNVARGIIVDEPALCDALERGVIAAAGLDVFAEEPAVPERLRALPNVVLTPHMSAFTTAAQEAQRATLLANLEAFFAGRQPRWLAPPA